MVNLGSKTSISSQIFSIPSNLRNHFLDLHAVAFVKNDRLTISVPIILNINHWRLSIKKVSDGQSDVHVTIKYVFIFLQIIIRSQNNWCKTQ